MAFDELRTSWNIIWHDVRNFQVVNEPDVIGWKLGKSNKFTIKSVYNGLTKSDIGLFHKRIWKGKNPAKIKKFLCLMTNDAILTKDNLRKRNWLGDPNCAFCDEVETISHLFFNAMLQKLFGQLLLSVLVLLTFLRFCSNVGYGAIPSSLLARSIILGGIAAICWAIWKSRIKACFERKIIKNPLEIICHACELMDYWADL